MQDVRFALRIFRRHPAYVAIVVATLGVALGAVTALSSVANATLLAPLPVPGGDRVVRLGDRQPMNARAESMSWPELLDLRSGARLLAGVAAERTRELSWRVAGEPLRVRVAMVSEGYLGVFAMRTALGRGFSGEEHKKGAAPVVVLSDGFWRRAFAGEADVLGRTVQLGGESFTVVGVLAPGGVEAVRGARDVYMPIEPRLPSEERGEHYLTGFARLAPGATADAAAAEALSIGAAVDVAGSGHRPQVTALREALYGKMRGGILLLFGAALLVLVIAGANVTSVMLARMNARAHELGVRAALGAGRGRIARQLLTESVILALAGGALGVLMSLWGKDALLALWPAGATRPAAVPLDWRVLAFAAGVAIAVGALVGAAPALRGSHADLSATLRGGAVPRGGRLRAALVVAQHAIAIIVLACAGLLGKSLLKLLAVQPGFDPSGVATMSVALPEARYPDDVRRAAFYRAVLERLRGLPGVAAASAISDAPFSRSNTGGTFQIEGRPEFPRDARPTAGRMIVDGDYFRTMRIPVLAGRSFGPAEDRPVLAINKTFADRFFPGESALGHRIDTYGGFAEVVGVVGDVRRNRLDEPPEAQAYLTFPRTAQWATFVVRATGDPLRLFGALKAQVFAVDPEQPVASIGTMDDMIAASAADRRSLALLAVALAGVALLLAALGIYGVLSYSVSQRTREIGVRMALGARAGLVLRLVLAQGLRLALVGVAIGVAGALVVARLISSFLYAVTPGDLTIYAGVALALLGVGLVACWAPARRAARVDPMSALRAE